MSFRETRRVEMYLQACKAWRHFNLSCADYVKWPLSYAILYDDFRQMVHDALFEAPGKVDERLTPLSDYDLSMTQLRRLEVIAELFKQGNYIKGCKKLRVI